MAALCERTEDDGFDRLDYGIEAWDGGARPERLFSWWRTAIPDPDRRKRLLVDDTVLLDLFEGLAGDERRQRVAYRFILALILMRKKLLKYAGRRGSGEDQRWLLLPKGALPETPPVEVVDPHLTDQDVRELTDQLGEVLQGEL